MSEIEIMLISVVLGAILGFLGQRFLQCSKMKEDRKNLKQQMITNNIAPMRQAWINDLRENLSEFISNISVSSSLFDSYLTSTDVIPEERVKQMRELLNKLSLLLPKIDLLLPFSREDKPEILADRLRILGPQLVSKTYALGALLVELKTIDNVGGREEINVEINKLLRDFIVTSRELLKQEWDVTKSTHLLD